MGGGVILQGMCWKDQGDESRLLTVLSQYSRVFAGARWMMQVKQDEVSVRGRGGKNSFKLPPEEDQPIQKQLKRADGPQHSVSHALSMYGWWNKW